VPAFAHEVWGAGTALFATCLADAPFPEAQTCPSPYSAVIAPNRSNATNRSCLWSTIGGG